VLKPAPAQLLLAMLLLPTAVAPPRRRPRQAISYVRRFHAGAGWEPSSSKAWSGGLEHRREWPGSDGSVLITERPAACARARWVLDPRPISGCLVGAAPGARGLLDVAVDPDFERNRSYLSYRAASVRQRHTRARATSRPVSEWI